jgi:muramoyltetrapeptide carboxypeptidase LdcA involved in peptidoglycan recycling
MSQIELIKPPMLKRGDKVSVVSLSWGGPGAIPSRYEAGKRQLEETGVQVVAAPHALKPAEWIAANPRARADDLMSVIQDKSIKGIVSAIGGDDSIRLLPFIDLKTIRANPKIFVGYSDTTVSHFAFWRSGIVSFYGPSIMSGFAENCGIHPYMLRSFMAATMEAKPYTLTPNTDGWTTEFLDWADPANQAKKRPLLPPRPWRWLQGTGVFSGQFLGGCIEVLDWLRGSSVWPTRDEWRRKIVFLEVSEEGMSPQSLLRCLRALQAAGVFSEPSGVLFGRPGGTHNFDDYDKHDAVILRFVREELGAPDLPVITQMDFGHTDPILTIPIGVNCKIDCDKQTISVIESAIS